MTKSILVVDDTRSMRKMVAAVLQTAGYEVEEAGDGVEALELARQRVFDLVVTDQNMPRMDGVSLIRELRCLAAYDPVALLVLSTEVNPGAEAEGPRGRRHRLDGQAVRSAAHARHRRTVHLLRPQPTMNQGSPAFGDGGAFRAIFFEEAQEHLAGTEAILLRLDTDAPVRDDLNAIFRAVHSIKGSAAMLGFEEIAALTHVLENLLDLLRKGERAIDPADVDAMLEAGDIVKSQVAHHRGLLERSAGRRSRRGAAARAGGASGQCRARPDR